MPQSVATLAFIVGILGLFWLTREEKSETSSALWIPMIWFFIAASRSFSGWFGATPDVTNPEQYLEGSPLDSALLALILAVGLVVLVLRARKSTAFIRDNAPLLIFLLYCVFSVLWSDYPFTAFKRWTKAFGNVVMVVIVLTDPEPAAAAKRFLTQTGFVLIPVSILLVKYYPLIGRGYDPFTGQVRYLGAVGEKNGLGYDCLIFGLGAVWAILDIVRHSSFSGNTNGRTNDHTGNRHKGRELLAHGTILFMVLYLFRLADSVTSEFCFALGCAVLLFVMFLAKGKPARVHFVVAALGIAALTIYLVPESYRFLIHSLGRDTTLTGRTDIWEDVLRLDNSPVVGTGFESFFLGNRLNVLWSKYWWHPQEAHDGYLEIYLTLGWVGVALLALLIISGYRNVLRSFRDDPSLGALRLAFLLVAMVYNFTEAAFKVMHPVWIMFLFSVVAMPRVSVPALVTKPVRVPVRKRAMRPAYSTSTRSSS